jgi:hypothetical protein
VPEGEDRPLVTSNGDGVPCGQRGQQQVEGLDRLTPRRPGKERAGDRVGPCGGNGRAQLPFVLPGCREDEDDPAEHVVAGRGQTGTAAGQRVDHPAQMAAMERDGRRLEGRIVGEVGPLGAREPLRGGARVAPEEDGVDGGRAPSRARRQVGVHHDAAPGRRLRQRVDAQVEGARRRVGGGQRHHRAAHIDVDRSAERRQHPAGSTPAPELEPCVAGVDDVHPRWDATIDRNVDRSGGHGPAPPSRA